MPKTRNTTIGSSSSDGVPSVGQREVEERLQQRLQNFGEIEVDMPSRSRGGSGRLGVTFREPTEAIVRSDSGNSYVVNPQEETCTCPDHTHRHGRCRHMEAVNIARELGTQGVMPGSRGPLEIQNDPLVSGYAANEQAAEDRNGERSFEDDHFFYTENPEAFEADMQQLAAAPVPFYYENALNGANTTFGIELEFTAGDSDAIARELYDLGICSQPTMVGYHNISRRQPGKWILESDGSVTAGRRGGELVSPVLTDTPETWRQIEQVCEVARRHGARVNTHTGGHIHIGADQALDGKRQRWRRFFKTTAGFETVFHRLAGGEQGQFRGGGYARSSRNTNLAGVSARLPTVQDTALFQSQISRLPDVHKYRSINLSPFSTNKKTIEFRAFNGTLNPGIIQANVKYAAGVVSTCERSRTRSTEDFVATDSDRKRGRIINDYANNNRKDNASIAKALDVMFARKEDKEQVLSVIVKNQWER